MQVFATGTFQTKKELATAQVRHAIRIGRYKPGDRLRQNDLARDLGLSSTPVREALTELQASGLVVHESHRGVRVASLDVERIEQVYTARRIIERETARLAFAHVTDAKVAGLAHLARTMAEFYQNGNTEGLITTDEAFHLTIMEMSGNPFLVKAVRDLWNSFPRYFMWNIGRRIERSLVEHEIMVTALRVRDLESFITATERHTDGSLRTVVDHLSSLREASPKSPLQE